MFGLSMISLIIGSFAIIPITMISHGTASSIVLVLTINIISSLGLLLAYIDTMREEKNHTQTEISPILPQLKQPLQKSSKYIEEV